MADTKLTGLGDAATTDGTEYAYISQGGVSKRVLLSVFGVDASKVRTTDEDVQAELDRRNIDYDTRADLIAATVPADKNYIHIGEDGLDYFRDVIGIANIAATSNGATVIWSPVGNVFVEHFGAISYSSLVDVSTGTNTYAEIISAYSYVSAGKAVNVNGNRAELYFKARYYNVEQTLTMNADGISLNAPKGTVLYTAHSLGAGVWIQESNISLGHLEVRGDFTRANTMDKTNMGVRIEPLIDDPSSLITQINISNITVRFHGGSAVVANSMSGLEVYNVKFDNIKRHGLVICNYAETGRTGTRSTGIVNIGGNTRINDCEGHRLLFGAASGVGAASAYRIDVWAIDGDRCGSNAAILEESSTDFSRGSDITFYSAGFISTQSHGTDAAITLAGTNITLDGACRFTFDGITASDYHIYVQDYADTTRNIYIGGFSAIGTAAAVASIKVGATLDLSQLRVNNVFPLNQPLFEGTTRPIVSTLSSKGLVEYGASAFGKDYIFEASIAAALKPYYLPETIDSAASAAAMIPDIVYFFPVVVPPSYPIDTISFRTTSSPSGSFRVGIYSHDYNTGLPDTLIEASASTAVSTSAQKDLTITAITGHRKLWVAMTFSGTPNVRVGTASRSYTLGSSSLEADAVTCLQIARTYTSLPANLTGLTVTLGTDLYTVALRQA